MRINDIARHGVQLIGLLLLIISLPTQASEIKQMYEVSLPVVNQQADVRRAAFEQGLIEVSVRVSGTSLAPTQLDLGHASRMVRQYRYQSMSADEISAYMKRTAGLVPPKYKLWMQFDDGKIKQLLKDNILPIWGYQRPDVLVWLAVKDGQNRYLLKAEDESQIKDALEAEARKRGLPIVWPSYDMQDRGLLKFSDVWGQFWEPVNQASQRYAVDAVLLGRMNWVKGSWQVDWSLQLEDKTDGWRLNALDLGLLMNSGIGVATDTVSSRFAVFADSGNSAQLVVRISNLNSVKRYADASRYLATLAAVKHVYATEVDKQQVDFHVDLNGDENDLKRIIALGKVLVPDPLKLMPGQMPGQQPGQQPGQLPGQGTGQIPPGERAGQQPNTGEAGQIQAGAPSGAQLGAHPQGPVPPRIKILRYKMSG